MTPERLADLLAEAVPDGTFGGARPTPTRRSLPHDLQTTPAEEAAMHKRVLDHEVAAYDEAHRGQPAHRHLAAVPAQPAPATTTRSAA